MDGGDGLHAGCTQHGLDRAVGDILAAVDASGERDNTVIWFVNDNGGATNNSSDNGELRGMKGSVFEGGVRVVAFMSGGALPQGLAGGKRTGMMHIADVHATICTPSSPSQRLRCCPWLWLLNGCCARQASLGVCRSRTLTPSPACRLSTA